MKPVKKVSEEDAPRLLTLVAYANLEAGDRTVARQAAEQLSRFVKRRMTRTPPIEFCRRCQVRKRWFRIPPRPRERGPKLGDERPVIRRREALPMSLEVRTERRERPSYQGRFVELQCADPARMVIDTPEGKKVIMIDDPTRLLVNGNNAEKMDLQWGGRNR